MASTPNYHPDYPQINHIHVICSLPCQDQYLLKVLCQTWEQYPLHSVRKMNILISTSNIYCSSPAMGNKLPMSVAHSILASSTSRGQFVVILVKAHYSHCEFFLPKSLDKGWLTVKELTSRQKCWRVTCNVAITNHREATAIIVLLILCYEKWDSRSLGQ